MDKRHRGSVLSLWRNKALRSNNSARMKVNGYLTQKLMLIIWTQIRPIRPTRSYGDGVKGIGRTITKEYSTQFGNKWRLPTECCLMSIPPRICSYVPGWRFFNVHLVRQHAVILRRLSLTVSPTFGDQDVGQASPFPESMYGSTAMSLVAEVKIESWSGHLSKLPTSYSGDE